MHTFLVSRQNWNSIKDCENNTFVLQWMLLDTEDSRIRFENRDTREAFDCEIISLTKIASYTISVKARTMKYVKDVNNETFDFDNN